MRRRLGVVEGATQAQCLQCISREMVATVHQHVNDWMLPVTCWQSSCVESKCIVLFESYK